MEKEDERIMGDKAQGCGKWRRFTEVLREKVNNFCIRNSEKMVKWIDMYDRAQKERTEGRKNFRLCNRGRAYPEELEALPKIMTLQWLENALLVEERRGGMVSNEEWEFSKGCDLKVMTLHLLYILNYFNNIYI